MFVYPASSKYHGIVQTSSTGGPTIRLQSVRTNSVREAGVAIGATVAGEEATREAELQEAVREYYALVPELTPEVEATEAAEWHAIVDNPDVQESLHSYAEEIRRQIAAGETEEGGYAVE